MKSRGTWRVYTYVIFTGCTGRIRICTVVVCIPGSCSVRYRNVHDFTGQREAPEMDNHYEVVTWNCITDPLRGESIGRRFPITVALLLMCSLLLVRRNSWANSRGQWFETPWRNNNIVITSKQRHFDVITSKWRGFGVITTSLSRYVSAGNCPSASVFILNSISKIDGYVSLLWADIMCCIRP